MMDEVLGRVLEGLDLAPGAEGFLELEADGVAEFLRARHPRVLGAALGGEVASVEERSDGNLNHVFAVRGAAGACIVKQALPFIRILPSVPLSPRRIWFERASLEIFGALAETNGLRVPKVLAFDADYACLIIELIEPHVVLRSGLVRGVRFPGLGEQLGSGLARTLFATSVYGMPSTQRARLASFFAKNTELCVTTEEAVFTAMLVEQGEPAFPNRWTSPQLDDAVARVRDDEALARAVGQLKAAFCTRAEALLHGDLHTGSILAAPGSDDCCAFDSEFAFMGPIGFDVGNVLGNLLLSYLARGAAEDLDLAEGFWLAFREAFAQEWTAAKRQVNAHEAPGNVQCGRVSYLLQSRFAASDSLDAVLAQIWQDALGFAGCEMLRRTIGVAHVEDLESIADPVARAARERRVLSVARRLAVDRAHLPGPEALRRVLLQPGKTAVLYLVAKMPRLGRCKTRLASTLGDEGALAFAQACVGDLVDKFASLELDARVSELAGAPVAVERVILFSNASDSEAYRAWLDSECPDSSKQWALEVMQDASEDPSLGKLGVALGGAAESAKSRGAVSASFIGMDTPDLALGDLAESIATVAASPAVPCAHCLPARDGGYVLLSLPCALARPSRAFANVSWSTPQAFATQLAAVSAAGASVRTGRLYEDVDTEPEMQALLRRLADLDDPLHRLRRLPVPKIATDLDSAAGKIDPGADSDERVGTRP